EGNAASLGAPAVAEVSWTDIGPMSLLPIGGSHARILRRADSRADVGDGVDPHRHAAPGGGAGHEIRRDGQKGFPDPALCLLLFLPCVCRRVRLAGRRHPDVLRIRAGRLGGCDDVWSGPDAATV